MFKSGNVLSSNGRGIVREVRVAVFAVISRHIRRRDSLLFSLSLSLSFFFFFFFFFFFVLLYYSYTYVWVVFGWNICCEERDKASFGQLFSFLGLIFAIFLFGNRPPLQKTLLLLLQNLREEAFSTFTLHNTPYWVDERERRGLQRARDGKSKTRVCVSSVVRSKERERERSCTAAYYY